MFGTCLLTVASSPPSLCSFTDPAISMDLLRAVLQPSINEEIQTVFNKYMKVRRMQTKKTELRLMGDPSLHHSLPSSF